MVRASELFQVARRAARRVGNGKRRLRTLELRRARARARGRRPRTEKHLGARVRQARAALEESTKAWEAALEAMLSPELAP